jgi:uncharacterized repeat protein (TIGR01451 family)
VGTPHVPVIVHLREQADVDAATGGASSASEARACVVSALQTTANRSQAPLRAYLEGARAAGLVESYTPLWIFNGIAVHARPSFVRTLAAHHDVAAVHLDHWRQWITNWGELSESCPAPSTTKGSKAAPAPAAVEWGIARVRADEVWSSLHISGTGTVVAGIDTGADWHHPALQASYRGYVPHGPANHTYSWYDATDGGALYPVDDHGHGSHTLGTAVGQGGIGVAPGARWMAVKVLNNQGYGYDSWIHEGLQWLLVPGGDPSMAPDVVNCSWGNDNGSKTTFQSDVRALRAAGIIAVFSSGNNGPQERTVGSPASLPGAFAVGATDSDDEVANFSSRGPSPWGDIRPHVAAPGVHVRSSLPGGVYDTSNGTSMAAPHVSGVAALLRSVSPTLSVTRATFLITSTAVPLGTPIPNNDAGWGRVDAFAAVAALAQAGFITGTVTQLDGTPIAGGTVVATSRGGGGGGTASTDEAGRYRLTLAPSTYDLAVSAFGYQPATAPGVSVTDGTTRAEDFSLAALDAGTLRGNVVDAATGQPVTTTVTALGTPRQVTDSAYAFALPAGTYTVHARRLGYRVVTATAVVTAGQTTVANLSLPRASSILLIDSGAWYYGSQAPYFRQALEDLAYAYEEQTVKHVPEDAPTPSDLTPYDVVIWSAPTDAPGYIGAQDAITSYLSTGGRLLLTGQDVGYLDGGGTLFYWSDYYEDYLKAQYVEDNAPTRVLRGTAGDIFAGLTITIAGAGGADNQHYPDEIAVADTADAADAAPVLTYQEAGCGGIRVETCPDYRVVYLSFGFEAINDRAARRETLERALDWLTAPTPAVDIALIPNSQAHIGAPGSVVTHTLRVRHVGQEDAADTISLSLDGASWSTHPSTPSLSLTPCASSTVTISVTVPASAGWNAHDTVTLTARSTLSPTLARTAVITTKTPAPILLVDDDRWYDQEDKYERALAESELAYDYWNTEEVRSKAASPHSEGGEATLWEGRVLADVLPRYPIVVWFTGYDWYEPVAAEEEMALATYLDGGGHLFLSSQDFLYHHHGDPFSRDYLGVISYTEDVTPTLAQGVRESPIGDRLGPYSLSYPFNNWSDALVPTPGTTIPFRDEERRAIALARQGDGYRTTFFSFPYEALPEEDRPEVIGRVVGWLSWLGGSTFTSDRIAASGGDTLSYTIALRNDGPETTSASLSNTLPLSLTLIPSSLAGPATYHAPTRRISWEGPLEPGAAITCSYRATLATDVPTGTLVANTASLELTDQAIHFCRTAAVEIGTPDLSSSALQCTPYAPRPGTVATCTLTVANTGPGNAPAAMATNVLPADGALITDSLTWAGGGTTEALTGTVQWTGPLSAGGRITLTYQITLPTLPTHPPLYDVALLDDGRGGTWERATWLLIEPLRWYFPLIGKAYAQPAYWPMR